MFSICAAVLCILFVASPPVNAQCGQSSIRPQLPFSVNKQRIINGNTAVPNSWPWVVNVFYDLGGGQGFMCGGSLINPNGESGESDIILTAAHCTVDENGEQYSPEGYTVTLGAQDISDPYESTQIVSQVIAVHPHESYDPDRILNDVALLKLASPVKFSRYVQPICLPTPGQKPRNPNLCYAVGWGRVSNDNSTTADVLQQVRLPILSDAICGSSLVWGDSYDATVMECAGYLTGIKSTCQGDSGGPLVCRDGTTRFILFGSTSFGNGVVVNGLPQCAAVLKPAVFARTSSFVDWIEQTARSM